MTYRVIQRPVEEYIIPVLESEAAAHLVPLHWFKAGRRSTHLEPLHGQASVLKVAVHVPCCVCYYCGERGVNCVHVIFF